MPNKPTSQLIPWDTAALGINCYELSHVNNAFLSNELKKGGHFTVKIHPLANKEILLNNGFYYVDTLLTPSCSITNFKSHHQSNIDLIENINLATVKRIAAGSFSYGRFHRDHKIPYEKAELRYENWIKSLHDENQILGISVMGEVGGFIAYNDNTLVLHAICENIRGRGLSKYMWTKVCEFLFRNGRTELHSSISATNLPILNLYTRLGFKITNAVDVYHCLNSAKSP